VWLPLFPNSIFNIFINQFKCTKFIKNNIFVLTIITDEKHSCWVELAQYDYSEIIEFGDKVVHKIDPRYNLAMNVTETFEDEVECDYYDQELQKDVRKRFNREDLKIFQKCDGNFEL